MRQPANHPERVLTPGEIVQLNPETCCNPMFAGCLMVVEEVKPWGAQGYVQALGHDHEPGGQANYRAAWEEMEITFGHAPFVASEELKEEALVLPEQIGHREDVRQLISMNEPPPPAEEGETD